MCDADHRARSVPVSDQARPFVMVGLCGGYTTFSSFSLQTLDILRDRALGCAAVNVAASVILCILAVATGYLLAAWINGHRPL
ncbi:CrcB family protein [Falsirhodobacter xinxiangensis]|uniref:CrcB family protein n=1 Tax=Falsirhodobacter xinxiangensis TaxID=2530049 RepID=UPI003312FDA1